MLLSLIRFSCGTGQGKGRKGAVDSDSDDDDGSDLELQVPIRARVRSNRLVPHSSRCLLRCQKLLPDWEWTNIC